jgi:hypothetical protein
MVERPGVATGPVAGKMLGQFLAVETQASSSDFKVSAFMLGPFNWHHAFDEF